MRRDEHPPTRTGDTSTAKSRLAAPEDNMAREDDAMLSNMFKAAAEDAGEMGPGSDTREKSVNALWEAVEGSVITEVEELRKENADSLIESRDALSAFEEYKEDSDAAILAAKRC